MIVSDITGSIAGIECGYERKGIYLRIKGYQDDKYVEMELPVKAILLKGREIHLEKLAFRKIHITAEIDGEL